MARDVSKIDPTFPRIANCYGAGLSWASWDKGAEYWSKLSLFIGGCYDVHYDWENERWPKALEAAAANIARIRQVNPNALFLPYVDVVEGPDNPNIPKSWWALNDKGERWSGWPGMFRINTDLKEVLQYNLDKVRQDVFGRECFDGVFYDCWSPDKWLVPETAKLRDGQGIVMINPWNLPREGFENLNGVLAEDQINRVIDGTIDFEDFLALYLKWCTLSRKPVTTTLVCRPQTINDDPWRWDKLTQEERVAEQEKGRHDEQTMRFGLATTLMGDGYFGYDSGTMGRGNWWWYKEYDAPLGHPKGPAHRNADGTWQREFDGGTVIVNGSPYDVQLRLPRRCRDVSTGRVGTQFTLPMLDGRIFLPTADPETTEPDVTPRITAQLPTTLQVIPLAGELSSVRTPGGLELRLDAKGSLRRILWRGQQIMSGGMPVAVAAPWKDFHIESVSGGAQGPTSPAEVRFVYKGTLAEDTQRVEYTQTCTVTPDNRFVLHFDFSALTDLDIRMWRHYFMFPVSRYAGRTAQAGERTVVLPKALDQVELLPAASRFTIDGPDARLTIDTSMPMSLIDHRKYGTDDYLLAGYPVSGAVKQGAKWSVEIAVTAAAR
jgi:hypothetical protein